MGNIYGRRKILVVEEDAFVTRRMSFMISRDTRDLSARDVICLVGVFAAKNTDTKGLMRILSASFILGVF